MQKDIYLRGIYERKSMSHASLLNTIKQKLLFSKKNIRYRVSFTHILDPWIILLVI